MSKKASRSRNAAINLVILLLVAVAVILVASGVFKGCSGPVNPERITDTSGLVGDVIQLEVLNGCGQDGLASDMQSYLRSRGFDVVSTGNYDEFGVDKTRVLDRIGDDRAAREVAKALGVGADQISSEPEPGLYLDATVIIGCDYQSIPPYSLK